MRTIKNSVYSSIALVLGLGFLTGCTEGPIDTPPDDVGPVSYQPEDEVQPQDDQPEVEDEAGPTAAEIAESYRELAKMTEQPTMVNPELMALCIAPPPQEVLDSAKAKAGPHFNSMVQVYMNEIAAGAFKDSKTPYPVGSVIVKEKIRFVPVASEDPSEGPTNPVGGMIKRALGYDPLHGDWEYFYLDEQKKLEQGKIATCVDCHDYAAKTDYVYGHWAGEAVELRTEELR